MPNNNKKIKSVAYGTVSSVVLLNSVLPSYAQAAGSGNGQKVSSSKSDERNNRKTKTKTKTHTKLAGGLMSFFLRYLKKWLSREKDENTNSIEKDENTNSEIEMKTIGDIGLRNERNKMGNGHVKSDENVSLVTSEVKNVVRGKEEDIKSGEIQGKIEDKNEVQNEEKLVNVDDRVEEKKKDEAKEVNNEKENVVKKENENDKNVETQEKTEIKNAVQGEEKKVEENSAVASGFENVAEEERKNDLVEDLWSIDEKKEDKNENLGEETVATTLKSSDENENLKNVEIEDNVNLEKNVISDSFNKGSEVDGNSLADSLENKISENINGSLENESENSEKIVKKLKKKLGGMQDDRYKTLQGMRLLEGTSIRMTKEDLGWYYWGIPIREKQLEELKKEMAELIKEINSTMEKVEEFKRIYEKRYQECHKEKTACFYKAIDKALKKYNETEDFLKEKYYTPKMEEIFERLNQLNGEEYEEEIYRIIRTIINEINKADKERRKISGESYFYYNVDIADYEKVFFDVMNGKADKVIRDTTFSISMHYLFFERCNWVGSSKDLENLKEKKEELEKEILEREEKLSKDKSKLSDLNIKLRDSMMRYIEGAEKLKSITESMLEVEKEIEEAAKQTNWNWSSRRFYVQDYFKNYGFCLEDDKQYFESVPERAMKYQEFLNSASQSV